MRRTSFFIWEMLLAVLPLEASSQGADPGARQAPTAGDCGSYFHTTPSTSGQGLAWLPLPVGGLLEAAISLHISELLYVAGAWCGNVTNTLTVAEIIAYLL